MNIEISRTVRDKFGNVVDRADGVLLDGDDEIVRDGASVRCPMMLSDGASRVQDTSRRIMIHDTAHVAGLPDQAARHAMVRQRLGDAATGKSAAFLDAAYATLAGLSGGAPASASPAAAHGMTDAQRAVAARGVEAALADAAKRGGAVADGAPRFQAQDRAVAVRAYDEMRRAISDGWKTPEQRAADAGFRADVAANPGVDPVVLALQARDAEYRAKYRGSWGR